MIVPQYWAEGLARSRAHGKQITIRRFGWSDVSQAEAQANADARAEEGLRQRLSGARVPLRDLKRAYNGSQGVPIREEIVARDGETLITRNAYGARCLNTPCVLFADIDFCAGLSGTYVALLFGLVVAAAIAAGTFSGSRMMGWAVFVLGMVAHGFLSHGLYCLQNWLAGGEGGIVRRRIARFLSSRPEWNVRLYRTPAGFRVLVTHRTFDPNEPAVQECFRALGTDPQYVRMCRNQQCFRARVSPKPWRVGIPDHMKPRPGVWPVPPERLAARAAWIARYERAAENHAACDFEEAMGSGTIHAEVRPVLQFHDALCRIERGLPLA